MKQLKRILAVLLALAFAFELSGCTAFGAPATTEELLVRYVANPNVSNYTAKAKIGLNVNALGVRAAIPVAADFRVSNNAAHGTVEVDLSALDTRNYKCEFYAELLDDAINCYIGTPKGNEASWKLWKIDMRSKIDITTVTELLSSSELTLIAKDSDPQVSYELTVPLSKVLGTCFNVTAGINEIGGMNEQSLVDMVGNDKVRVGFTKDCLMRSIDAGVLATVKNAETNNVQVRMGIDVSMELDNYGTVNSADVSIPDEVRAKAVSTDTPIDVIDVIGANSPLAGAVGHKAA
ncbi:MAG: hypothetical protein IKF78_11210 [Atopobiaceae bacterium]|nr:hypothetical protein [Atopobiaceae bacterium]